MLPVKGRGVCRTGSGPHCVMFVGIVVRRSSVSLIFGVLSAFTEMGCVPTFSSLWVAVVFAHPASVCLRCLPWGPSREDAVRGGRSATYAVRWGIVPCRLANRASGSHSAATLPKLGDWALVQLRWEEHLQIEVSGREQEIEGQLGPAITTPQAQPPAPFPGGDPRHCERFCCGPRSLRTPRCPMPRLSP